MYIYGSFIVTHFDEDGRILGQRLVTLTEQMHISDFSSFIELIGMPPRALKQQMTNYAPNHPFVNLLRTFRVCCDPDRKVYIDTQTIIQQYIPSSR